MLTDKETAQIRNQIRRSGYGITLEEIKRFSQSMKTRENEAIPVPWNASNTISHISISTMSADC